MIAAEYNMHDRFQIIVDLARIVKAMGEAEFAEAWRQAFEGQEPPDVIRDIAKKIEENNS